MTRATDEATFAAIFERHRDGVYAYLLGRLGDPEPARDLLQETFLRAWRRLTELVEMDPDRLRAWLFTVARNLVTDTYRARATRDATWDALRATARPSAPEGERPDARAETAELVGEVGAAVRALPEDLRVILAMHAVAGMTSAQIGAALGQPAGTIRYKLARARGRLAEALRVPESTALEVRR